MKEISVDDISIGDRVRSDMGDIEALAESMERVGLLHPIVVREDLVLVAGHRRLEAARLLGWSSVACHVVNVDNILSAEYDENVVRKDFTPTEAVAIGRLIEEVEVPKAKERMLAGKPSGKVSEGQPKRTRDVIGRAVGMSGTTYQRAKAVVAAAEEDPENFGDLPGQMDTTGNVVGTVREMQSRRESRRLIPPTNSRQSQIAAAHAKRLAEAVATIGGICMGLSTVRTPLVAIAMDGEQINRVAAEITGHAKYLIKFGSNLKKEAEIAKEEHA